jgi:hypothetical protein
MIQHLLPVIVSAPPNKLSRARYTTGQAIYCKINLEKYILEEKKYKTKVSTGDI